MGKWRASRNHPDARMAARLILFDTGSRVGANCKDWRRDLESVGVPQGYEARPEVI